MSEQQTERNRAEHRAEARKHADFGCVLLLGGRLRALHIIALGLYYRWVSIHGHSPLEGLEKVLDGSAWHRRTPELRKFWTISLNPQLLGRAPRVILMF